MAVDALSTVVSILSAFAKIPGPTQATFQRARDAAKASLDKMSQDANATSLSMQASISRIHGKLVTVTLTGKGGGKITVSSSVKNAAGFLEFHAAGGLISGGTAGQDSVLAALTPGEVVVPAGMVRAGAVNHLRGRLPGFAAGGFVTTANDMGSRGVPFASDREHTFGSGLTHSFGTTLFSAFRNAIESAIAAAASVIGGHAGPGGGAPAANAALARRLMPAWSGGAEWAAWNAVAMRESGWSNIARNASSGAYGIAQALPPTKYPFAGQAAGGSNPTAQITWMIGYIRSRYGDPIGALAHENAFGWYDRGGWLPPGASLAYNDTGQPEQVVGPASMAQVVMLLAQILAAVRVAPAATSAGTARALNTAARGGGPVSAADSLILADVVELLGGGVISSHPLCPGAQITLVGFDFGSPQPQTEVVASLLLDGERPTGRRASNRTISLPIQIRGPSRPTMNGARELLQQLIDADTWRLTWTPDPGTGTALPLIFDCFRGTAAVSRDLVLRGQPRQPADDHLPRAALRPVGHADDAGVPVAERVVAAAGAARSSSTTTPPSPPRRRTRTGRSPRSTSPTRSRRTGTGRSTTEDTGPIYTHTLGATVDITGLSKLAFQFGLGTENYAHWHTGNVTFACTLTDNAAHTLSASAAPSTAPRPTTRTSPAGRRSRSPSPPRRRSTTRT